MNETRRDIRPLKLDFACVGAGSLTCHRRAAPGDGPATGSKTRSTLDFQQQRFVAAFSNASAFFSWIAAAEHGRACHQNFPPNRADHAAPCRAISHHLLRCGRPGGVGCVSLSGAFVQSRGDKLLSPKPGFMTSRGRSPQCRVLRDSVNPPDGRINHHACETNYGS